MLAAHLVNALANVNILQVGGEQCCRNPNSSVRPLTIPVLTVNIILVGRTNPATKAFSRPVQLGVGTVSGVEVP